MTAIGVEDKINHSVMIMICLTDIVTGTGLRMNVKLVPILNEQKMQKSDQRTRHRGKG